jgi:hypothetical protein
MKANEPSNLTDTVDKAELVKRLRKFADAVDLLDSGSRYTISMRRETKAILSEAADFIASHTEGAGAEPVAWQWRYKYGDEKWGGWQNTRRYDAEELLRNNVLIAEETRPLYTSPTLPGDVVVVPREPTLAMSLAGEAEYTRKGLGVWSDFHAIYRSMIAAAPIPTPEGKVADADGWQDISTAPKDGTLIIAYGHSTRVPDRGGRGQQTVIHFLDRVTFIAWTSLGNFWSEQGFSFEPTHWRPLPVPPSSERE